MNIRPTQPSKWNKMSLLESMMHILYLFYNKILQQVCSKLLVLYAC